MSLTMLGGGMGVAACFIGLAIFLGGCAGFSAIFMLSVLPVLLGTVGLVLSVVGPTCQKAIHVDDPAVFAALFLNVLGIVGGLLLMAVWRGWPLMHP